MNNHAHVPAHFSAILPVRETIFRNLDLGMTKIFRMVYYVSWPDAEKCDFSIPRIFLQLALMEEAVTSLCRHQPGGRIQAWLGDTDIRGVAGGREGEACKSGHTSRGVARLR